MSDSTTQNKYKLSRQYKVFLLVLGSVLLSTILRALLNPLFHDRIVFITYFPTLAYCAWIGGWRGGLLSLALSTVAGFIFFHAASAHSLSIRHADEASLIVFIAVGLTISAVICALRQEQVKALNAVAIARLRESELRQREERYRTLLETANEGVLTVDETDNITYVNPRFADMLGALPERLAGQSIYSLLYPEDVEIARRRRYMRQAGIPDQYEIRMKRQDGSEVWVQANVSIIQEGKRYSGTFSLMTDITARKNAEMKLTAAYRYESLLNKISQSIRKSALPEEIMRIALAGLGEALEVDRCQFIEFDMLNDRLHYNSEWVLSDLPTMKEDASLSSFDINLDEIFSQGQTLRIADTQTYEMSSQTYSMLLELGIRAVMAVPFFDDSEVAGILAVSTSNNSREWTDEEVSLVEAVASQLRSAMELAQIHVKEHTIAVQLQEALQPNVPPSMPGLQLADYYRSALEEAGVGGDFSDVFPADKRVTYLIVGDLSGKGLAAASQVATVRNMLRFALYNGSSLASPINHLNRTLAEHNLLTGFATLFACRYDACIGSLTYVNCGQEPALLKRANTGEIEELLPTGPVLGGFEEAEYEEKEITLAAGDMLIVFTDGMTEAGPNRAEMVGVSGIIKLLEELDLECRAQEAAHHLVQGVDTSAQKGVKDDVCLLVAIVSSILELR